MSIIGVWLSVVTYTSERNMGHAVPNPYLDGGVDVPVARETRDDWAPQLLLKGAESAFLLRVASRVLHT